MTIASSSTRVVVWFRSVWSGSLSDSIWVVAVTFAVAFIGGVAGLRFLRWLTWLGDLVELAVPLVALVLLVVLIVCVVTRQPWVLFAATTGLLAASLIAFGLPRLAQSTGPPVTPIALSAVNLQFDSGQPAAGVESALGGHPDVLVVSELTRRTDRLLSAHFPYRVVNDDRLRVADYGQGVYSMFPLENLAEPTGLGKQALRVRVDSPAPFILYALHLPRPHLDSQTGDGVASFSTHRAMTERLDELVRAEQGAVVIAGDLNLSDRTEGYDILSNGRVDALRTGWAASTYVGGWEWDLLMLRIDHIFLSGDWCARNGSTFGLDGSDHAGVRADIGPCA